MYEPVKFSHNIVPVCVPEDDSDLVGETAWVTGWGRLYEGEGLGNESEKRIHLFNTRGPNRYLFECIKTKPSMVTTAAEITTASPLWDQNIRDTNDNNRKENPNFPPKDFFE